MASLEAVGKLEVLHTNIILKNNCKKTNTEYLEVDIEASHTSKNVDAENLFHWCHMTIFLLNPQTIQK